MKQLRDYDFVSLCKRGFELLLEQFNLRRVRARLKDRDDAATRVFRPGGQKSLPHSGRMMGEIIDHGHAAYLPSNFQPAPYALELRDRLSNCASVEAEHLACRYHAQTVAHVE